MQNLANSSRMGDLLKESRRDESFVYRSRTRMARWAEPSPADTARPARARARGGIAGSGRIAAGATYSGQWNKCPYRATPGVARLGRGSHSQVHGNTPFPAHALE